MKKRVLVLMAGLLIASAACGPSPPREVPAAPTTTRTSKPTATGPLAPTLAPSSVTTREPVTLTAEAPVLQSTQEPEPTRKARPAGDNAITKLYVHASDPECEVSDYVDEYVLLTINCDYSESELAVIYSQLASEAGVGETIGNFRAGPSPVFDKEWKADESGMSGLLLGGYSDGVPIILWTAKGETVVGFAASYHHDLEFLTDWFVQEEPRHYISYNTPTPEAPDKYITKFFVLASDPSCKAVDDNFVNTLTRLECSFADGNNTVYVTYDEWVREQAWKDMMFINIRNKVAPVLDDTWTSTGTNAKHGPYIAWLDEEGRVILMWGVDGRRLTGIMLWYNGDVDAAESWFLKQGSRHHNP